MTVTITPDPDFPLGGYAIATFKGAQAPQGPVMLKISRLEDGYYLGSSNWASNQAELGPFEVVAQDAGVGLRLGPEVVDLVEPFQRIRIEASALGVSSELSWPETIRKAAGSSRGGSIHRRRGRKPAAASSTPSAPLPQTPPEARPPETPKPVPAVAPTPPPEEGAKQDPPRQSFRWVALLLVVLIVAAGAGAWFYMNIMNAPETVVVDESLNTEPQQPVTEVPCGLDGIDQAGAAQLYERAQACSRQDIGVEERMISRAALLGHGPALLQQAKWFDPTFADEDSPYETRNAVSATRLYKKALDAGEEDARPLLDAVCEMLRASNDPVMQITAKSNCE